MNLSFNNQLSEYELTYLKWEGIHYDRSKLKKFIKRYRLVSFLSRFFKNHRKELNILNKIIDHYGRSTIINLSKNDNHSSRLSHIERLSRIGSVEILTLGLFKSETYRQISNLPKTDFDLVSKRIQELIKIGQRVTTQNETISETTPNDKI